MKYTIVVVLSCVCIASSTVQPPIHDFNNLTAAEDGRATDVLADQYSEDFLSCVKLALEAKEYEILQNGSAYVPAYGATLDTRNYYISNGVMYVCHSLLTEHFRVSPSHNRVEGILSFIFLISSCVCLALHLLIFIIVPEYRTLFGKIVASLAVCLFMSYSFYLLSDYLRGTPHCSGIAAAICYFYLASFFWMNSLAFEVWISLKTSTKLFYEFITRTKESTRYFIYALYSFGVPLVIVSVAVMIDRGIFGVGEFVPVFSEASCWFESYKPFIVFFITPFITLTLLDLLYFVLSIVAVTKLKVSSGKHELSPRKRLILCLRLAAATGLPWIVGIFIVFIDWHPLRILFIICTALQGVYIFVAYNCNKKTLKYLVRTFKGRQESPTTSVVKNASTHI